MCCCEWGMRSRCHWRPRGWEFRVVEHKYVRGLVFMKRVCIIILEWDNREHEHYYFKKRPNLHLFCSVQDVLNMCSIKGRAVSAADAAKLLDCDQSRLTP